MKKRKNYNDGVDQSLLEEDHYKKICFKSGKEFKVVMKHTVKDVKQPHRGCRYYEFHLKDELVQQTRLKCVGSEIPNDIWEKIFGYCDVEAIRILGSVCKKFNQLLADDSLRISFRIWDVLLSREDSEVFEKIMTARGTTAVSSYANGYEDQKECGICDTSLKFLRYCFRCGKELYQNCDCAGEEAFKTGYYVGMCINSRCHIVEKYRRDKGFCGKCGGIMIWGELDKGAGWECYNHRFYTNKCVNGDAEYVFRKHLAEHYE